MLIKLLPELREEIFSYCSVSDLQNLCCTSSNYNELLKDRIFKVVTISEREFYPQRNGYWKELLGYYYFLQLSMQRRLSTNIRKLRTTKTLIIRTPRVHHEDVSISQSISKAVASLDELVDLRWYGRTRPDILQLSSGLRSIKNLSLYTDANISKEDMMSIGRLTTLEQLELFSGTRTRIHFSSLSNLTGLKKIEVYGCHRFTAEEGPIQLPLLEELILRGPLPLKDILCIGKFVTLKKLRLRLDTWLTHKKGQKWTSENNEVLSCIKNLINLEELYLLGGSRVTDVGIAHLQAFVKLHVLKLGNCNITNVGLHCIAGLSSLAFLHLDLYHCNHMTGIDGGILQIVDLPNLRWLNLRKCGHVADTTISFLNR